MFFRTKKLQKNALYYIQKKDFCGYCKMEEKLRGGKI